MFARRPRNLSVLHSINRYGKSACECTMTARPTCQMHDRRTRTSSVIAGDVPGCSDGRGEGRGVGQAGGGDLKAHKVPLRECSLLGQDIILISSRSTITVREILNDENARFELSLYPFVSPSLFLCFCPSPPLLPFRFCPSPPLFPFRFCPSPLMFPSSLASNSLLYSSLPIPLSPPSFPPTSSSFPSRLSLSLTFAASHSRLFPFFSHLLHFPILSPSLPHVSSPLSLIFSPQPSLISHFVSSPSPLSPPTLPVSFRLLTSPLSPPPYPSRL